MMKRTLVFMLFTVLVCFSCNLGNGGGNNGGQVNIDVEETMSHAIAYLESGDYSDALAAFEIAVNADPDNTQAVLYWVYLKSMSLAVQPEVAALARGAGIADYPSTMEALFNEGGLNMTPIPTGGYEYYDNSFGGYITEPTGYSFFPQITIHSSFQDEFPLSSYYPGATLDAGSVSTQAYMIALIYNLSRAFPDGFTQEVEDVVDMLDENLSDINAKIAGLTSLETIELTPEMFNHTSVSDPISSGWEIGEDGQAVPIVIGQAEVGISIASIEIIASLFNTVASVSLTFPFEDIFDLYNPVTYTTDPTYDLLPPYPMKDMLQSKVNTDTYLNRAKAHISSALSRIDSSIDLIQERTGSDVYTFSMADFTEYGADLLGIADIAVSKMRDSIDNGITFYIPMDIEDRASGYYADPANWPDTVNWSEDPIDGFPHSGNVFGINLSALYDRPLLALDSLFELDSNGEPIYYNQAGSIASVNTVAEMNQAIADGDSYILKLSDVTLGGLIDYGDGPVPAGVISDIVSQLSFFEFYNDHIELRGNSFYYCGLISPETLYMSKAAAGEEYTATYTWGASTFTSDYVATGSFWYTLYFHYILEN